MCGPIELKYRTESEKWHEDSFVETQARERLLRRGVEEGSSSRSRALKDGKDVKRQRWWDVDPRETPGPGEAQRRPASVC